MESAKTTKQKRFDDFYMKFAKDVANFSYCKRKQVGAVFVKDDIVLIGYNGTISGFNNDCEDEDGETRPDVLHAESNVFAKIMRSPVTSTGGTMYCTLSPCIHCAKQIIQGGISRFLYIRAHSDQSGVELMKKAGVEVIQMDFSE